MQPPLFEAGRDFTAFDRRRHADFTNPWLIRAQREARSWGQARGWPERVVREVDRALVIVLSGCTGEKIRHSDLFAVLSRRALGVLRPAEILDRLELLDVDRPMQVDVWLTRKLTNIAPGIRREAEHWLRTLIDGGPRTQPRSLPTARNYLNVVRPILITWSSSYQHLREVTRDDILAAAATVSGAARRHLLTALRSLFRHCKKTGTIFRDPAARVRVGRHDHDVLIPLRPEQIDAALAAVSTPVARLAVALAGVHAARPHAILAMRVDDIELGDRRLTIAGRVRPLDDLTRDILIDWMEYRRARWPTTANPHLIINQRTALDDRPASKVWLTQALCGQTATLERLRMDRQLDEAITRGPDPLHLANVFGLDDKTAIRYADAAKHILQTTKSSMPRMSVQVHVHSQVHADYRDPHRDEVNACRPWLPSPQRSPTRTDYGRSPYVRGLRADRGMTGCLVLVSLASLCSPHGNHHDLRARVAAVLSVLSPLPALPLSGRELCGDVRHHLLQQNLSLLRR